MGMNIIITDEQIAKIKDCYASNNEVIEAMRETIANGGCTDTGLCDESCIGETFEAGFASAIEWMCGVLGIVIDE